MHLLRFVLWRKKVLKLVISIDFASQENVRWNCCHNFQISRDVGESLNY